MLIPWPKCLLCLPTGDRQTVAHEHDMLAVAGQQSEHGPHRSPLTSSSLAGHPEDQRRWRVWTQTKNTFAPAQPRVLVATFLQCRLQKRKNFSAVPPLPRTPTAERLVGSRALWSLDGVHQQAPAVGMKTDASGRENPSTIFISVFYYRKRERERNSRARERK